MAGQKARALRAAAGIALAIAVVAVSSVVCGWAASVDAASKALRLSDAGVERGSSDAFLRSRLSEDLAEVQLADGLAGTGLADGLADSQPADSVPGVSLAGEGTGLEAVPSWFAQELFPLDGTQDVRVSAEGDVVGFVVPSGEEASMARFREALCQGGWTESETGIEGCSVFMKGEGICRWAMISCIPVGDATSVVARCVVNREKP